MESLSSELDDLVHGVMAKAGTERAMGAGSQAVFEVFVKALSRGKVRALTIHCNDVPAEQDTEQNLRAIVQALDPESIEKVSIQAARAPGSWLDPLVGREFKMLWNLDLTACGGLVELPDGVFDGMGGLENLVLSYCDGLSSLREGVFDSLGELTYLYLHKTTSLASLPEGVFDRLGKLSNWN